MTPLCTSAPSATLSVVARNVSVEAPILVLNSSGTSWNRDGVFTFDQSSPSNRIAWQSAYISDVVPLLQPVSSPNWSHEVDFFGPSFKCRPANSMEQADFNRVMRALEIQHKTFTATQIDDKYWNIITHPSPLQNDSLGNLCDSDIDFIIGNSTARSLLFYSSWATHTFKEYTDSWWPNVYTEPDGTPTNKSVFWTSSDSSLHAPKYTFLRTSTSSIVCSPINASFKATIASMSGRQQITQRGVTPVEKSSLNRMDQDMHDSQFVALASTLAGDATLDVGSMGKMERPKKLNNLWSFVGGNCNIIARGLLACEEIQNSPFISKMSTPNETNLGIKTLHAACPTQLYQC
ncbi:hypothetical protein BPAE_0002g00630 [Botrytis paeoniae]|uniref:Uncharacterized protein n=1 Tax=Botrytis paeoniae TaxID=278948 RepID=A0A4Z1G6E4_9HELO|nr:hypothetical protein BPAE_0002g00630 [Botrytis paeoniae]